MVTGDHMDATLSMPQSPPAHSPDVVLYHADCADGFGAAWAIWKRFPTAQYVPVKHGFDPPPGLEGRHIVLVDFSYPRETVERLAAAAASLQILDHHVTAQATLADLPYAHFDMKKSGAVLAWEWAHREPPPWLLRYIQDKDLWEWRLPQSRAINAALASYPFDFGVWDQLEQHVLEVEGLAILRYEQALLPKIIEEAVLVSFEGCTVPAVYSPILNSHIGERLCDSYPFCIIWHQREGRRYFSLRSKPGTVDVSAIAARYGGGGHVNAAGFSLPLTSEERSLLNPFEGISLVPLK
ncbi:MAG: phosphoesterase [Nitrospirae bacterium]|nr:MAG: phosphoesterase [Nitrospirota bacterium]